MGGTTDDATIESAPGSGRRGLKIAGAIVGATALVIAGAIMWRYLAVGDGADPPTDRASDWIAGYAATPEGTELNIVVEACADWGLDETWIVQTDPDRVEVRIGWWDLYLSGCSDPELRTFTFQLSEPLGDRGVFELGGGEIPRFEGEYPPAEG